MRMRALHHAIFPHAHVRLWIYVTF
ncbi:uncharacterized protein METZ01_LOCUS414893, partial [marine metagenome]